MIILLREFYKAAAAGRAARRQLATVHGDERRAAYIKYI